MLIGSDNWSVPNHYLDQCWNIVDWNLRNKLQWNCMGNSRVFIWKWPLRNGAILPRPFCENGLSVWVIKCIVKNSEIYLQVWLTRYFFVLWSDVYRSFIRNKTTYIKHCLTRWISWELWNPKIKAISGKLYGFGGHSKTTAHKTKPIVTGLGHGKLS